MGKIFRPSTRESSIISKIESSKEHARRLAIGRIPECAESLGNAIASKLVEESLVETRNKNGLEKKIVDCLEGLIHMDDFDVDYQVAPYRTLVPQPHVVSLFVTAFVIEKVIDDKDVVDIYGSDEQIYFQINQQVTKYLP
jgi:hypothetical protein